MSAAPSSQEGGARMPRRGPQPVCIATTTVDPVVIIATSAAPSHFRVLLRIHCPHCRTVHVHGAGEASMRYWRVPHCRDTEAAPYVLRVRALDAARVQGYLSCDDRVFTRDTDDNFKIRHEACDALLEDAVDDWAGAA